jgi:hypothetical protein
MSACLMGSIDYLVSGLPVRKKPRALRDPGKC